MSADEEEEEKEEEKEEEDEKEHESVTTATPAEPVLHTALHEPEGKDATTTTPGVGQCTELVKRGYAST